MAALGDACELSFAVGAGVMALLSGGGYGEYAVVDERHVMNIPEGFTWAQVQLPPLFYIRACMCMCICTLYIFLICSLVNALRIHTW